MEIGERIKNRRIELGMSVDELAQLLGKNRATIYRYESSEIEKLPTTILEPLAVALQTTPAYLMGWEQPDAHPPNTLLQTILNRLTLLGFDAASNTEDLTNLETLIKLADKYEATLDYLVGRAEKNVPIIHSDNRDDFAEVFRQLSEQELDSLIGIAKHLLSKK